MANENDHEYEVLEAGEARSEPARRADANALLARAEARDMLSPLELDARQEAIGERRRKGGPPVDEVEDAAASEEAPDVPETEVSD